MQLPITLSSLGRQAILFFSILFILNACAPSNQENSNNDDTLENNDPASLADMEDPLASPKLTVNRPFEKADIEFESMIIEDPTQDKVFKLESGAVVNVPANIFVNQQGQAVTGPVKLVFREFHTAEEILISGIPMLINQEDGSNDWLQTAGMFEIRGFDENDQAVEIAEGESMSIDLISRVGGDYDTWFFDEEIGNWVNTGRNENPELTPFTPVTPLSREIAQLERDVATPPMKDFGDEADNLIFNDLDVSACPGLNGKKALVLNYAGTDMEKAPRNNDWITDPGIWIKKELKPTDEEGIYKLTLMGDKFYSIPVRMGLQGADLKAAEAKYEQAMAKYARKIALLKDKKAIQKKQQAFRRTMMISELGIHNYDILWKNSTAIPLAADFYFEDYEDEELKKQITVYLITEGGRLVVGLDYYTWKSFRFDPESDNFLIASLPGEKVALFTQKDFEKNKKELINSRGQDYVFKMDMIDMEVTSEDDIRGLYEESSL